jgi:hypothetical protein
MNSRSCPHLSRDKDGFDLLRETDWYKHISSFALINGWKPQIPLTSGSAGNASRLTSHNRCRLAGSTILSKPQATAQSLAC